MTERTGWVSVYGMSWSPWTETPGFHFEDGNSLRSYWLNVDTGARMCLVAHGGWRDPKNARFVLYYRDPHGETLDVSGLLQGARNAGYYEPDQEANGTYAWVMPSCEAVVEEMLGLRGPA